MSAAIALYGEALDDGGAPLVARTRDGRAQPLPLARWLAPAAGADERALAAARGPVLDIGCGPGRHTHALARRGVPVVGVDVSPQAVRLARRNGATVVKASIFDRLPGAGRWRTALLLDGNIGIGGCPEALLARVAELVAPAGAVVVELSAPGGGVRSMQMRLERGSRRSAWFAWAEVAVDAVDGPAGAAGLTVSERWHDGGRWFATLRAP